MQIENIIRSISRPILLRRLTAGSLKNINNLITHLKTKRKYITYPVDKYPPNILKYHFFRKSDLKWLNFYYSIYGEPDQNLISVPVYLYIETCLNDRMLTYAVKEKNFYNKYLTGIPTPTSILRRINGFYYDDKFQRINRKDIMPLLNGHKKLILKPSIDSGAGKFIFVFENHNGIYTNREFDLNTEFLNRYNKDFIIQEFVTQHSFYSQFNPSSNNTIKIFTYRSIKDDSVNLLHSIFWVGAKGHFLDHDQWGGFGLSINEENKINKHAIDVSGNKHESIDNILLTSLDKVPAMDEIKALAKKIANNIYYGRLLALDFTVNSDGDPLLIDINCRCNGIHQYQMHNGGLFKEFTKEILDYCQNYQPRFTLRI